MEANSIKQTVNRPLIVCLCGSTRFHEIFNELNLKFTLEGKIILSIGLAAKTDEEFFGHLNKEEIENIKIKLDILHLRKIELSDEVFIINKDKYIGESTAREIEYAMSLGKKIKYLEYFDAVESINCNNNKIIA